MFEKAVKHEKWLKAMDEEISTIQKNDTWKLTDLPEGKDVVGLKWIFKTKYNSNGEIQRHKAHLVAKGSSQKPGVDYDEVFSPIARMETIRTLLALAAQFSWTVYNFDVKSTFLNGDIEEEVYVEQPRGYVIEDEEEKVYKLNKALYGLKQASRAWYNRIDQHF